MHIDCYHCGHRWDYKGSKKFNCTCPVCRRSVNLRHDIPEGKKMSRDDINTFAAITDESLEQLIFIAQCERSRRKCIPGYKYLKGDAVKTTFERMRQKMGWGEI